MPNINQYSPATGRRIKEDGTVVNQAEMIEAIYNGLVVNKDAGIQLSGSKAQVTSINADSTGTIAGGIGLSEIVTITPTVGYMAKIVSLYFLASAPTGGSTGTHQVELYFGSSRNQKIFRARSVFGSSVLISSNTFITADSYKEPSADAELNNNLINTYFDNENPLKLYYQNQTDVDQTADRVIRIVVKEVAIV